MLTTSLVKVGGGGSWAKQSFQSSFLLETTPVGGKRGQGASKCSTVIDDSWSWRPGVRGGVCVCGGVEGGASKRWLACAILSRFSVCGEYDECIKGGQVSKDQRALNLSNSCASLFKGVKTS